MSLKAVLFGARSAVYWVIAVDRSMPGPAMARQRSGAKLADGFEIWI
jgi:hypothetical protein